MSDVLSQAQREGLRGSLLARRQLLKAELRADKAAPVSVESESQGYEEAYLDGIGHQVESELNAQHRVEFNRITAALKRMDDGSYGTCEDCGGAIGAARLLAFPTARLCIECKELVEREHRTGS